MKYEDRKLVSDVIDDLLHLTELANSNPSGHDIRRSTHILRNLLLAGIGQNRGIGYYREAWIRLGFLDQPSIETNTITSNSLVFIWDGKPSRLALSGPRIVPIDPRAKRRTPNDDEAVLLALPARGGVPLRHCLTMDAQLNGGPPTTTRNEFKVSKFLRSAGLIVLGHRIPRDVAIEFIFHKRGGAHLDWNLSATDVSKGFDVLRHVYDPTARTVGVISLTKHSKLVN